MDDTKDATTTTAATNPTAPVAQQPPSITLTPDQYQRFLETQAELAAVKAQQAAAIEAERQRTVDALAKKGEVEKALTDERTKWQSDIRGRDERIALLDNERLIDRKSATVSAALAGKPFVSDYAAQHVHTILSDKIEAWRDLTTGEISVREKGTLKPAGEAIAAWLAGPEAAHFLVATTKGGSDSRGGSVPAPETREQPKTFAERAIEFEKNRRQYSPNPYAFGSV